MKIKKWNMKFFQGLSLKSKKNLLNEYSKLLDYLNGNYNNEKKLYDDANKLLNDDKSSTFKNNIKEILNNHKKLIENISNTMNELNLLIQSEEEK